MCREYKDPRDLCDCWEFKEGKIVKKEKTMKKLRLPLILLMVLFVGCAGMGINLDTPEKKYLGARAELNLLLEQYIQIQGSIKDADHAKAKEAFNAADLALDTWELMLGQKDYDFSKDIRAWLTAKNVIIDILRKVTK